MYQKILIINLMYIGDLLFTTPLIQSLRTNFPAAHIAMLADAKNADVIKNNPNLSEVIAIDKKGYHNKLVNYIGLISDIRKQKYDLVVNLHANERATAIAAFSGAKNIVGFAAKGFGMFFNQVVEERKDIHQADAYLEVCKAIGVRIFDAHGLALWVDDQSQAKADDLWHTAFGRDTTAKPVIGLNSGGSWPTKRWTKSGFAALADKLLSEGFGVIFFGGPMDVEDVTEIRQQMSNRNHKRLVTVTGKTTLLEMAALVKKCAAFVSGDSGPMHIAVSQKVPVVAIFGPSDPRRYSPYHQPDAVILSNKDCLGCGEHSCVEHGCMVDITVNEVWQKLVKKL
ncbi:lipopolysaccharide heptosyltransferase II [Sporomusa sp.]|uniref:lipopolysaccharide heptosyltransferase II n=1 Tax=Sporomusa sp. TaxID=2078658 RepID=UPI002C26FC7A|nr:lipopolysaccharide heptosyltransferase II [Sporomusa sp.]HWR44303.1 lipopolysaccharide heptosyltransferase II [Sporomusa sp.]